MHRNRICHTGPGLEAWMAWQSQSAMAGNGGAGGGVGDGSSNGAGQPQGTEYTLQGACKAKC